MTKPPFALGGLDHIVLRVVDLERMLAFYVGVLGCTREKDQPAIGLYQLRAGSSLIDLIPVGERLGAMGGAAPGKEGRNLDHLCLAIDRFDAPALTAYLEQAGADVGEMGTRYGARGNGPSLYLTDPEGNVVELKGPPGPFPAP